MYSFFFQITLLYPLYDRFSRMGDRGWRLKCTVSSFVGILFTVGVLLLRLPALHLLEKIIAPFLISFSTILEITAFVFIYGENLQFFRNETRSVVPMLYYIIEYKLARSFMTNAIRKLKAKCSSVVTFQGQ